LVKRVRQAISISIRQWTAMILLRAGLIQALVKRIRHTIAIRIWQWAAMIFLRAG